MKQSKFTYAPKWPLALATVSVFALSASFAAAQDNPPAANQPAKTGPRTQLETVVTSATRVETSAQTTPVATTSVSGVQLERTFATDLRDLTAQAPNVHLEPVGAFQTLRRSTSVASAAATSNPPPTRALASSSTASTRRVRLPR